MKNFRRLLSVFVALGIAAAAYSQTKPADMPRPKLRSGDTFRWARCHFTSDTSALDQWDISPYGDVHFLKCLQNQTGIQVDTTWHVALLDDINDITKYPLLFVTADGNFNCTPKELANLKEYILRGGFVFADDCVSGKSGDRFFQSFRQYIERAFGQEMFKLPNDHEIYHCYYDLPGLPYVQGQAHGGWALYIDGRLAVFLSPSDLHCGWCSLAGKNWFTEKKGRDAVKMGINTVIYTLTH